MPGNGHVPFGKRPTEKDQNHGQLAGGLLHPPAEGWLYLATTIDLFNREVIGHAMAGHMRADLVCRAARLAYLRGLTAPDAVFHSDYAEPCVKPRSRVLTLLVGVA